eukprot:TRINITY_DN3835_c0_g1_i1.p1 TRINITY_DN3835_c0_g1~~TRINITY_DN3835_c0_g1_i1.p1  ORF type:complete len:193 (+),score=52.57 TRINITY_DN3835_c0_g1_i1:282-860(+)
MNYNAGRTPSAAFFAPQHNAPIYSPPTMCQLTPVGSPQTNSSFDDNQAPYEKIEGYSILRDQDLVQDVKENGEILVRNFRDTQTGDQNIYINNILTEGDALREDVQVEGFVMNARFEIKRLTVGKYSKRHSLKKVGGGQRNSMIFIHVTKGNQKKKYCYGPFNAYSKKGGKERAETRHSVERMIREWNNRTL